MSDAHPPGAGKPEPQFHIQIDRAPYAVHEAALTGEQLRLIPPAPIGADRDLFEVIPGGTDKKIEASTVVDVRNGLRFFSAPAQINPGAAAG